MLEKKPFAYVTIRELCEEAGVNRSTFYLHYENTVDLLKETTEHALNNFASYFSVDMESIHAKFLNTDLQDLNFINEKYLLPYLSFIKENQRLFMAVISQPMTFDTNTIFRRLFENVFVPILDKFRYPKDEQKYVMMFYLNGITAITTEWLKDGCQKRTEDIATIIHYCIFGRDSSIPTFS